MRARIIYLLFVLLLAMTWSAESVTPESVMLESVTSGSVLPESVVLESVTPERMSCEVPHGCAACIAPASSIPLYICMSAEVSVISFAMDSVTVQSLQKVLYRHRSDAPAMRPERVGRDAAPRPKRCDITGRTADYYVFSLERIIV